MHTLGTFKYQTFVSFVRNHQGLFQNTKPYAFFLGNLSLLYETQKGFVLEGSESVPEGRTFKDSVDLKTRFLDSTHLGENFEGVR